MTTSIVPGRGWKEMIMRADERIERAGLLHKRAVFGGDVGALATAERGLATVEADHPRAGCIGGPLRARGRSRIRTLLMGFHMKGANFAHRYIDQRG